MLFIVDNMCVRTDNTTNVLALLLIKQNTSLYLSVSHFNHKHYSLSRNM
jgi:hypothetical protein